MHRASRLRYNERRGDSSLKYRNESIYAAGIILLIPVIVCGQLLWLFDPLRLPNGSYLMDYVHVLIGAVSLIPLLWTFGALRGLMSPSISLPIKALRLTIAVVAAAVAGLIILNPRQIVWIGVLTTAAILLIFLDLIASEIASKRRFPWRTGSQLIILLVVLGILLWPTKYLVLYPGITMDMNRYVHADGGNAERSLTGVLIFQRPAFPIDWLYASMFPHYSFSLQEELGMSLGEYNHIVHVMRQDADTVAAAVALEKLGIGKGAVPQGALTAAVTRDGPAHGYLLPGDIIIQVDQYAVRTADDLLAALASKAPGEVVRITVQRNGQLLTEDIVTAANPDDPESVLLGIHVMNHIHYDVPRSIDYRDYLLHEGGPSHGAMLTLAIIDQLTPGGVTGKFEVAGTGTIAADGSIGAVGGVRQKAFTVARSGADVFFVPEGQEHEARAGAEQLTVVPVKHIDDILQWLEANNVEEETENHGVRGGQTTDAGLEGQRTSRGDRLPDPLLD